MRATSGFLVLGALLFAALACKSPKQSAQLRDTEASALPACPVKPDSVDDDRTAPNDGDLVGCPDEVLSAEALALTTQIGRTETSIEEKAKLQDKAEGKTSPGVSDKATLGGGNGSKDKPEGAKKYGSTLDPKAPPVDAQTPVATTDVAAGGNEAGLRLTDADDLERLRRDADELRRQVRLLTDRQTAIDREIARRTGQPNSGGVCVLLRGSQITDCSRDRSKEGCRAFSATNSAFYYRFGVCDDFPIRGDFDEIHDRLEGACVKVRTDFKIDSCRAAKMGECFGAEEDLGTYAFRTNKACELFRTGEAFENMTPQSQLPTANTRFETDCRTAGATLRRNPTNIWVCPCGANNDLTDTVFYQRGIDSCRQAALNGGGTVPLTGTRFETDCRAAGAQFRRNASNTLVCACGTTNELNEANFYQRGIESCRQAAGVSGTGTRFETDCRAAGAQFRRNASSAYVCACGTTNELIEATFYQRGIESCRQAVGVNGTGTRFETDCRATGAQVRRNTSNVNVCACGNNNDLTETLFYQRGADACRQGVQNNPLPNNTPEVKDAFRRSCSNAGGSPQDDALSDDGMSCRCGLTKLSLRSFARDRQDNNVNAFEDACRRNIGDTANTPQSTPSQVVRQPGSRQPNNNGTVRSNQCVCTFDSTRQYCGVFKGTGWLTYMGPLGSGGFNCGNTNGASGTNDLCFQGTLKQTLQSADCR